MGCALCPVTKKLSRLQQKLNPTLIIWTCIYILKFEWCVLVNVCQRCRPLKSFFRSFYLIECGNSSELKKGAVLKILLLIYIGVHRTVGTYSCRLAVDNSKPVNPTKKVDTLGERRQVWLQLWEISLFLSLICCQDRHGMPSAVTLFIMIMIIIQIIQSKY